MSTSTSSKAVQPKKLKAARRQVSKDWRPPVEEQSGKEYNIWFSKWAGGDRQETTNTLSLTRCVLMRDAGYTRADAMGTKYCCLFFARGCCPQGVDCTFLHRLPPPTHVLPDAALDCFAREKHADYRDDMGGIGSFTRVNRTLYIGRIRESGTKQDTEEMVRRHFGEFGEIFRINILPTRGVAFVTYTHELSAQFAKEAMSHQSLDSPNECINVRWATEDPNPGEIKREKRRVVKMGKEAIEGKLDARFVEAEKAVEALEGGRVEDLYALPGQKQILPGQGREDGEGEGEDGREGKRRRIEGAGDVVEEHEVNDEEEAAYRALEQGGQEGEEEIKANGLLDRDALEGMKYFLEIKRRREEEDAAAAGGRTKAKEAEKPALGLLGGYGSESEED